MTKRKAGPDEGEASSTPQKKIKDGEPSPSTSQSPCSRYANEEYTVGWICALPIEMAAAKGMLDEEHGDPQTPPQQPDHNSYILGRMGRFNIVIACLPRDEIGASSAAAVAKDMLFTYPNIRVGLLVGIGAGIPDYDGDDVRDIRLGDVVISSDKENGGVVAYDFGKRLGDGSFKSMYTLNRPPRPMRAALAKLEAEHQTRENKISQYMNEMVEKYPFMKKKGFLYPGRPADRLFKADYLHVSGKSCEKCDTAGEVERTPQARDDTDPVIHYGVIATGSSVIKHTLTREEIKDNHRAICLEMEAAGIMNSFPCVVIRGISDYADSHKNDQWHPYAAAAAAACAKELLEFVQPTALETEQTAKDVLEMLHQVRADISLISTEVHKIGASMENKTTTEILNWLSPVDYSLQQIDFFSKRQSGTGQWLLESAQFMQWFTQPKQTLLCRGIPGAGKTIMASVILNHLTTEYESDSQTGIAYIYCNFRRQYEQRPIDLFLNLLKQMIQQQSTIPECVKMLYESHINHKSRPSLDEILKTLPNVVPLYDRLFIVVDAIDECQPPGGDQKRFVTELLRLQQVLGANILATSRFVPVIEDMFSEGGSSFLEIRATHDDVQAYLVGNLYQLPAFISEDNTLKDEVISKTIEAADGMFLLARLHLGSLQDKISPSDVKHALSRLPKGDGAYEQAYGEAMRRIHGQMDGFKTLATRALSWIACAKRPLTTHELQHALAVRPYELEFDRGNITDLKLLTSVCAGLLTVDEQSNIIRLVHYTVQTYFEQHWETWFPSAHRDIATICVTYLSYPDFQSGICRSDEKFILRLNKYQLYDYASHNWGHHCRLQPLKNKFVLDLIKNDAKISACSQAMMARKLFMWDFGYSQRVPKWMTGLHLAAYFGLEEIVLELTHSEDQSIVPSASERTPLSLAAEHGHNAVVSVLLDRGINHDPITTGWIKRVRTPLSWAAGNGHVEVVKLLVGKSPTGHDSTDESGRTALSWAAENGHEAVAKVLLENSADPNSRASGWQYEAQTPLSLAVQNNHKHLVKLLLENGADPELRDVNGHTVLSWAAKSANIVVAKILLAHHANPNPYDGDGWTPLLRVVQDGREAVAKVLLENGANPNYESIGRKYEPQTPLFLALQNNHEQLVKLLLENGVDPESRDIRGRTPLSQAAENADTAVTRVLLAHHANPNSQDADGWTPLLQAARDGREAVAKVLLENGANPNYKSIGWNSKGQSPLSLAVENNHKHLVKLLLEHGADPRSRGIYGRTPLSWAADKGYESVVKTILDFGVDPNVKGYGFEFGELTPLLCAAQRGYESLVKLLLDSGADADVRSLDGKNALDCAAENGHEAVSRVLFEREANRGDIGGGNLLSWAAGNGHKKLTKALLEGGADPNSKDASGRTSLSWAVGCGRVFDTILLLKKGADVYVCDAYGRTPLDWAMKSGCDAVVQLLSPAHYLHMDDHYHNVMSGVTRRQTNSD